VTYLWRSLTNADTPAWSALTVAIAEADDSGEWYVAEDLAEELEDPNLDLARDTIAVTTDDGTLVAFGQVAVPAERADGEIRAGFDGGVHPAHRGNGIGSELFGRMHRRTIEWAGELFPDRPAHPQVGAYSPDAAQLFEKHGYRPVRYFHTMVHDLTSLTAADDDRLQDYDAALDEQVRAAHIDAFAQHWNSVAPTAERWRYWYSGSRTFRPALSTISLDQAGGVVAYLLSYEYEPRQLWFGQIGVRHGARGRGLGRSMVRRTLAAAAAAGYIQVKLDVDTDNVDGAGALYESVGFVRERTKTVYRAG
jgi:mycothiol synthase